MLGTGWPEVGSMPCAASMHGWGAVPGGGILPAPWATRVGGARVEKVLAGNHSPRTGESAL